MVALDVGQLIIAPLVCPHTQKAERLYRVYLPSTSGWLKITFNNRTCINSKREEVIERSQAVYDVLFLFSSLNKLLSFIIIKIVTLDVHIHCPEIGELEMPSHKTPRYCLYRTFVDAYMKAHSDMTRCVS
jgi:hypothetical protein